MHNVAIFRPAQFRGVRFRPDRFPSFPIARLLVDETLGSVSGFRGRIL